MKNTCLHCRRTFEITADDLAFYEKISPNYNGKKELIPPPTFCPRCRRQRRLSLRNERHLYHRKCDLTGRQIISMYSPDKPYKVYDNAAWWSGQWDADDYGRDVDFSRPFFEQFNELMLAVPRINLIHKESDNSDYCNFVLRDRNCYLAFTTGECEDSYYTNRIWRCRDICDCSNLVDSELCYEVIDSNNCYNSTYLQNCAHCTDCTLGYDLQNCRNCFACFGLRNAEYCIGNNKMTKEEYEKQVRELRNDFARTRKNFDTHLQSLPRKYMQGINAAGCTGDAISNSTNATHCFWVKELEDCKYLYNATAQRDSYDVDNEDHSELVYESCGSETNYMHLFNDISWYDKYLLYCSLCFHCEHLFGCVGMQRRKHCILNKQYTKEQYEELVPRIIEHMRHDNGGAMNPSAASGSWGEYFPPSVSPFGYNETVAQEYYPLDRAQALARGFTWHDGEEKEKYKGPEVDIPHSITDVADDITKKILRCDVTGRPFKIIPQELDFYRRMQVPLPRRCPDQRHADRQARRNPVQLWQRECGRCGKDIDTSYSPERPETVLCEECYLASVY